MKKKLAWAAAILIAALVSAAFLRPAELVLDYSHDTYTFSAEETTPLRLIGEDAALFSAELVDITLFGRFYAHLKISGTSPEKYYTVGLVEWDTGTPARYPPGENRLGYVERLGEDGWERYCDVEQLYSTSGLATNTAECVVAPSGEDYPYEIVTELPMWTPGKYRVMFTVRDFHTVGQGIASGGHDLKYIGRSGDEVYEVGFEYTVPEASGEPMDVLFVDLTQNENPQYSDIAYFEFALRTNGDIRYLQPDTIRFERLDASGGYVAVEAEEYPAVLAGAAPDYSLDYLLSRYTDYLDYHVRRFGDFPLVTVEGIALRGWNTTDTYRFSATFAENVDGSGERYTVEIPLRFAAAD